MFKDQFLAILEDIKINLNEKNILNKEVNKENLIKLSKEGLSNYKKYPDDKMCRWLGYVSGVIFFTNEKFKVHFKNENLRKNFILNEKKALNSVIDHYFYQENDKNLKSNLSEIKSENNPCNAHFLLGFYQGLKIAENKMSVESERDFTRPYFHSYYNEKISTFDSKD